MRIASVKATIQEETWSIHKYIRKTASRDDLLEECLRWLKTDGDEEQKEELQRTTQLRATEEKVLPV